MVYGFGSFVLFVLVGFRVLVSIVVLGLVVVGLVVPPSLLV